MKVLGMEVRLLRTKRKKDLYGEFQSDPPTIWVNARYPRERQDRTLIHEYFHAMYHQMKTPGTRLTEEEAAILFEAGVLDLWFNNRDLLTQLSEGRADGQVRGPTEDL
jgi:hypothetical protein